MNRTKFSTKVLMVFVAVLALLVVLKSDIGFQFAINTGFAIQPTKVIVPKGDIQAKRFGESKNTRNKRHARALSA
jgi:hypothetical protein